MTNAQIILLESIKLMEQETIKGTGRIITVQDKDGNKKQLEEPEELHTFSAWKKLGYKVKKGEHAKAKFPIWKFTSKKILDDNKKPVLDDNGDEMFKDNMFMKLAFFFTADQVEKIK